MNFVNLKTLALGAAALVMLGGGTAMAATTLDNSVNVLSGPGSDYRLVGRLDQGQTVNITRQNSDWCRINAPDVGWIPCADITGKSAANVGVGVGTSVGTAGGWTGYDFNTDPYFGPNGGLHSTHENGTFF